jgi:hypothetical protein
MIFKLSEILRYCKIFSFQTPIGSQRILMVVASIFPQMKALQRSGTGKI